MSGMGRMVGEADVNMKQLSESQSLRVRFHNFKELPNKPSEACKSPLLMCHGHNWAIVVFPGGRNESCSDSVSLFLCLAGAESGTRMTVKYSMRVKEKILLSTHSFAVNQQHCGHARFLKKSEIDSYLEGGTLVVEVTIQVSRHVLQLARASMCIQDKNQPKSDFLQMLESGAHADGTFLVDGEKFPFHKAIVAYRSPGFLNEVAEFLTERKEFEIDGVESSVFRAFLRFVYGEEVPQDLAKNAETMLKVADRFGCPRLKLLAEYELVKSGVTAETAADLILLADAHNCALLKETAIAFFRIHACNVLESDGWSRLRESRSLLEELLKSNEGYEVHGDAVDDYDKMGVVPLRRKLSQLGLPFDGSRDMLVKRLKETSTSAEEKHLTEHAARPENSEGL